MHYEERLTKLRSEYEQVALSISQPVQRMAFLQGQMEIVSELWKEDQAALEAVKLEAAQAKLDAAAIPTTAQPEPALAA